MCPHRLAKHIYGAVDFIKGVDFSLHIFILINVKVVLISHIISLILETVVPDVAVTQVGLLCLNGTPSIVPTRPKKENKENCTTHLPDTLTISLRNCIAFVPKTVLATFLVFLSIIKAFGRTRISLFKRVPLSFVKKSKDKALVQADAFISEDTLVLQANCQISRTKRAKANRDFQATKKAQGSFLNKTSPVKITAS